MFYNSRKFFYLLRLVINEAYKNFVFSTQKYPLMPKDLNKLFEDILARYIRAIERDYKTRYKNARDKQFIFEELTKGTKFIIDVTGADQNEIVEVFKTWYNRGEDINEIFAHIRKVFGEIEEVKPYSRISVDGKKIPVYINEQEKALKSLALNDKKLMKLLLTKMAFSEIERLLPTLFTNDSPSVNPVKSMKNVIDVKWTGEKDNRNEFVQLIYGLHQAKLINKGEGEITKIVEELATLFQVNLGNSWQSNLSASIHKTKNGSNPQIFSKIRSAYEEYALGLAEDKKKNR